MSYLQCPDCRLTVPATAYYLKGDQCPRCLTSMVPRTRLARRGRDVKPPVTPRVTPWGARAGDATRLGA